MKSIVSTIVAASLLSPLSFAGDCDKAKEGKDKAEDTALIAGDKKDKEKDEEEKKEEALLAGDKKKDKDKDEEEEKEGTLV